MAVTRTIVVAGAGIGGLTAALALAAQGFRVVVLEKAERLEEAGAGLQLSPNASRVLVELGLQPRLAARAVMPDAISIMSARDGGEIARLPLGEAASLSRRRALLGGASRRPAGGAAGPGQRQSRHRAAARLPVRGRRLARQGADGGPAQRHDARQQELALALIGADGIWSAVRHHLFPEVQPQFSGLIAWRGTLDATQLPREYTSPRVQLWMGPNAHLVAYPISGGAADQRRRGRAGHLEQAGLERAGDANEIKNAFASPRWPATGADDDRRRRRAGANGRCSPCPTIGEWSEGAIALLGDAAHAMLPFAAQGAGMAIEDAAVLAKCLGESAGENTAGIAAALKRYARLRRAPRAAGAARRAAAGTDLSSERAAGAGARSRHQGDGTAAHAGAAGLDLRLAGVRRLAGSPGHGWRKRP